MRTRRALPFTTTLFAPFGCVLKRVAPLLFCTLVAACHSSSDVSSPPNDDDSNRPTTPANLGATALSSTETRLDWEPSVDDFQVVGYSLFRDGHLIAQQIREDFYVDQEVAPLQSYDYSLVAIDAQQNQSLPAYVSVTTPDGDELATINRANYAQLLREIFSFVTGGSYKQPLLALEPLVMDSANGSESLIEHEWHKTFDCDNDGSATSVRRDGYVTESHMSISFSDCLLGGSQYDGQLNGTGIQFESPAFSVVDHTKNTLQFSGNALFRPGSREPFGGTPTWIHHDASITQTTEQNSLIITNATTRFSLGHDQGITSNFLAHLEASLTLTSSASNNLPVTVSTPESFHFSQAGIAYTTQVADFDWQFSEGELLISAEDGSSLRFSANKNNNNIASIILQSPDTALSFDKPWALWRPLLSFESIDTTPEFITTPGTASPLINIDNYGDIISRTFDIMTGTEHWRELVDVPLFWSGNQSFDVNLEHSWAYSEHVCENDGSARTQHTINGWYFEYAWAHFTQCLFDARTGMVYDGIARGFTNLGGYGLDSDALTLALPSNTVIEHSGWIRESSSFTRLDNYALRHSIDWGAKFSDADVEQLHFENASIYYGIGYLAARFQAELEGEVILHWPTKNGKKGIRVTTPVAFRYSQPEEPDTGNWYYQTGRMHLLAEDASELILNADPDSADSVIVTLNNQNGSTQYILPWNTWDVYLRRISSL